MAVLLRSVPITPREDDGSYSRCLWKSEHKFWMARIQYFYFRSEKEMLMRSAGESFSGYIRG
jgi:hypothetical protein